MLTAGWPVAIGPAPHQHFGTAERLASWVTLCPGQGLRAVVPGAGAIAVGSWAVPGQAAAGHPLPVRTVSGKNYNPDPGVLLYHGRFCGFWTGGGLREWTAPAAGGPWTTPASELVRARCRAGPVPRRGSGVRT